MSTSSADEDDHSSLVFDVSSLEEAPPQDDDTDVDRTQQLNQHRWTVDNGQSF